MTLRPCEVTIAGQLFARGVFHGFLQLRDRAVAVIELENGTVMTESLDGPSVFRFTDCGPPIEAQPAC